jgi:uncharacterized protein YprB with RNaseH-like and TPR domain
VYSHKLEKSDRVIERENEIEVGEFSPEFTMMYDSYNDIYEKALFFDLEHYVYKKPICVGVFGCCYYDKDKNTLDVTQYMIENDIDAKKILYNAKKYFETMYENYGKRYIVTFSGNNDFTIINFLFEKYGIDFKITENFIEIDLQKEYEKAKKTSIGLKALEKEFNISRDSELISGQNLAKTFGKIMKDTDYINRMPGNKIEKILLYNEQDVVSLFYIYVNWKKTIKV